MSNNSNNSSNSDNQNSFLLTKQRLEALSDGVFAIVMTLLVIEIKVPEKIKEVDSSKLIDALVHEKGLFLSYFLTFAIISVLWQAHHFLFNNYAKNINRWLIVLNTTFLSFISLIPFSSHFLGVYFDQPIAVLIFGLNTLIAYALIRIMNLYILNSFEIQNHKVELRIRRQASFRSAVNFVFTILGMLFAFVNTSFAIFLFLIPVLFNFIPGLLNALEKLFGFEL
jgi:uncharacterized membrane protein